MSGVWGGKRKRIFQKSFVLNFSSIFVQIYLSFETFLEVFFPPDSPKTNAIIFEAYCIDIKNENGIGWRRLSWEFMFSVEFFFFFFLLTFCIFSRFNKNLYWIATEAHSNSNVRALLFPHFHFLQFPFMFHLRLLLILITFSFHIYFSATSFINIDCHVHNVKYALLPFTPLETIIFIIVIDTWKIFFHHCLQPDCTMPFLIAENLFPRCDLRFYSSEFPVAISSRFISASLTPHFYYADPICMNVCDIFQMLHIFIFSIHIFSFHFGNPASPSNKVSVPDP